MKTPLDEVIEEIKTREVSLAVLPYVNLLITEMQQYCKGMTLEQIELWMVQRQEKATDELLSQVSDFETTCDRLVSKMKVN